MSIKELDKKNWNYELEVLATLMKRIDIKLSVHRDFGDNQVYHKMQHHLSLAHSMLDEANAPLK